MLRGAGVELSLPGTWHESSTGLPDTAPAVEQRGWTYAPVRSAVGRLRSVVQRGR
jgi:hypothetical protein